MQVEAVSSWSTALKQWSIAGHEVASSLRAQGAFHLTATAARVPLLLFGVFAFRALVDCNSCSSAD
jgi:hypothetical protein